MLNKFLLYLYLIDKAGLIYQQAAARSKKCPGTVILPGTVCSGTMETGVII